MKKRYLDMLSVEQYNKYHSISVLSEIAPSLSIEKRKV